MFFNYNWEGDKVIVYRPIGIIHTPFKEPRGTPIQPIGAKGVEGIVEVFPEYVEGLEGLEGFSHIILIYHFHLIKKPLLKVKPYMGDKLVGIFATRAPPRPNPIGISVVRLLEIKGNILRVCDVDIVDGTPLLDIKPYVPAFNHREVESIGWLEGVIGKATLTKDNGCFMKVN